METRIVTRVIIYKDNKILLCRNQGADFWYPGGGKWQDDEDIIQCAVREAFEETGQKIKVIDLMYVQEFYISRLKRNLELFFLAEPLSGSLTDHNHHDLDKDGDVPIAENRWFTRGEMKKIIVKPVFINECFWSDIKKINKRKFYFKKFQENIKS